MAVKQVKGDGASGVTGRLQCLVVVVVVFLLLLFVVLLTVTVTAAVVVVTVGLVLVSILVLVDLNAPAEQCPLSKPKASWWWRKSKGECIDCCQNGNNELEVLLTHRNFAFSFSTTPLKYSFTAQSW